MKIKKYLLFIIPFLLITKVNATTLYMNMDCSKYEIYRGDSLTCPIKIYYEGVDFNTVEFNYSSNFDISFTAGREFTLTNNFGKVTASSTGVQQGLIYDVATICNAQITAPANITLGNSLVNFTSIKVSDSTTESSNDLENVSKTINVLEETLGDTEEVDLTLKSITIDDVLISGFSPSKTEYNVKVNSESVRLQGIPNVPTKTIVTGHGQVLVRKGTTVTKTIRVESSDDRSKYKEYQVVLSYPEEVVVEKSKDNTLKSLELYNGEEKLDFTYDNKKNSFDYSVSGDIEIVRVEAELNDSKASFVNKYGPRDVTLNYGKNKIEVKIKAESGDSKTYTLNITRMDNRNADATLSSLKVNGQTVELESDKYEYKVDVKYNVTESKVEAVPTSSKSKVEMEDISLVDGENEPIVIKVTAENGDKKEYKLIINRLSEEESKITFENITITGYEFPFKKDVKEYDLEIKNEDEELEIVISPDTVSKEILGNSNLIDKSVIIINIKDDDGQYKYTINIHKPGDSNMALICYGVFGLGVILLISSIVYVSKKKKRG